ncbi:MAG: 4Fe-4S dicluster domain-containing protein [Desulfomonilia bacterium]|jgi:formate dehydrogenase iron-sulfur subunit|uniref:Formate dehydrogenase-O iron-sulfur subunit n=1 Tax=anaerobic digester metagenome TaxID=1263854 RepID=A0A485LYQ4_9ZZZZ|nr:4Fe-4S dicluster domain-containing protein [Pseudomonadota bacterium]HON39340.1 4Fe-4S dicluster domain-containing protein [Deltaproteobacteria bacterium]HRS57058.1 4Fe-4S dicluster domain-containing protein [Desulfomonilia bacterium]HPD22380.1 4Fe-4S dicluster domain-containing protein [Deltaproteobacteria bacterium]HPX17557.1 4Fe-4S dicluster domain-containing protein [Deltaproteobacteria bacterium]
MTEYIKLIDLTKCTGCRACQVACKNWNDLPAESTGFTGSLQNPADLSYNTWCLIRFDEIQNGSGMNWIMRHDACMHCEWPACVKACPSPGALVRTDTGAVVHDPNYCIGCKACTAACPFDIPRYSAEQEKIAKCTLCYDRITDGRKPACVTACPTGCLTFGSKAEMLSKADARAAEVQGVVYPRNPKYRTNVLYIMPRAIDVAQLQHTNPNPKMPTTILWWKNLFKPFTLIGMGAVAGAAMLHYMVRGPHEPHGPEKKEGGE